MSEWFVHNPGLVFLVYGMTYIIIATAILSHNRKNSEYSLNGVLWLFAAYALVHAPADFIDMWYVLTGHQWIEAKFIGSLLTYVSYAFLFEFGRRVMMLTITYSIMRLWYLLPILLGAVILTALVSLDFGTNLDVLIGYFVRFPGGIMAGVGIIIYYRNLYRPLKVVSMGKYFYGFGISLILWALFCGLVRTQGSFFPSTILNTDSFFQYTGFPVFIFRSLCGLVSAWSVMGILNVFNQEKQARLISALKSESKSRRYLERIITNITDPLVVTDRQGVIVMVNRAMESLTGRVKSHLIGKHVGTLLVQKDRDGMIDGTLSKGEPIEAEVRFISKENKEIPAVFSMSPISDGIDKDIKGFVGVAKDITIRKRIEAALAVMANNNNVSSGEKNRTDDRVGLLWKETVKRNEADIALLDSYRFLQTIIDSVDDEVIVRNIENQVVMLNVSARKRKQLLANSNASCMNVLDGCTYPCDECGNGDIESVVRSIGKTVFFERIYTTGDFKYIYEVSASPLYGDDGKLVGIVEVGRDVTKRRELERDVIHVYESERQRIGQDLHDDLMQNLIGIDVLLKMAVHSMKNKYSDLDENNEDSIRLKEISHFLENTISKSRRLARGLCPVDLGAGNFIPAVRQMVEESAGIYGIECSLDICSEAFHFDDITARHLFYIIREAVTNARKHSKATKINISMKMNDGLLKLEVMDNGKGFGNGIGSQDGLGMRIMRYRADMIGAQLIINSGNEGTSIACIVGVKGGNNENKMEG